MAEDTTSLTDSLPHSRLVIRFALLHRGDPYLIAVAIAKAALAAP